MGSQESKTDSEGAHVCNLVRKAVSQLNERSSKSGADSERGRGAQFNPFHSKFHFHGKFGINVGCCKYSRLLLFHLYFSSTSALCFL